MSDSINAALGLGEDFKLSSGETIQVFPACLSDLEEAMKLYADFSAKPIQAIYLPANKETKESFESILLIANGQRDVLKDEEKRPEAVKTLLSKFTMSDNGVEVRKFVDRFLGLVPRDPELEEQPVAEQQQQ